MSLKTRRICIFAHYNAHRRVAEYVFYYLQQLRDELGADLVFVSTSEFPPADRDRLENLCLRVLVRSNENYDFGSWRDGLRTVRPDGYDEVILANDSCYGPLFPLKEMWNAMAGQPVDFWGVTDCIIYSRYIESYFIVFRRPAFLSRAFADFWNSLPDFRYKHDAVTRCEQQLTQALAGSGLRYSTYVSFRNFQRFRFGNQYKAAIVRSLISPKNRAFIDRKLQPIEGGGTPFDRLKYAFKKGIRLMAPFHYNALLQLPDRLIREQHIPFVKKMLFEQNPLGRDLDKVKQTVRTQTAYPYDLLP